MLRQGRPAADSPTLPVQNLLSQSSVVRSSRTRNWVIGDVHGCHQSLLDLLAVLPSGDHLVFLGDVISRGAAIEATMDLVWNLVTQRRATWLRGNHEQRLIDALESSGQDDTQHLLKLDTYRQLGEERAQQWLQRLRQLPFVFRADGWSATHAGFNSSGEPDLSIRDPFWESYDGRFGLVVVGHTPRPQVERYGRIVLIDTGAVYGGLLTAFCPETDAIVQVPGARSAAPLTRSKAGPRRPTLVAGDPGRC